MSTSTDALDFTRDGPTWPHSAHSRFVEAAGFLWHVQVLGSGPPLVLVHGTGASTHSWHRAIERLSRSFSVINVDLPGHGFTATPDLQAFTLPGMAAALADLLDAMNVDADICAGHSAGAAVLIEATLQKRIAPRVIVSVNGALLPFQGVAGQVFSPLAKLLFLNPFMPRLFAWRGQDVGAVRRLLRSTGSSISDDDLDLYRRLFATSKHCSAALTMMARWDLDGFSTRLRGVTIPLVLVSGGNDQAIRPSDARRAAAMIDGAEILDVPGAGHLLHEEHPELAAEIVENAYRAVALGPRK